MNKLHELLVIAIMDFKIFEGILCNVLAIIWFTGLFLVCTKNKYTMEYLLTLNHIKCWSCSCAHGAHIAHADTRDAWAGQLVSCHTQHITQHKTSNNRTPNIMSCEWKQKYLCLR